MSKFYNGQYPGGKIHLFSASFTPGYHVKACVGNIYSAKYDGIVLTDKPLTCKRCLKLLAAQAERVKNA